MQRKALLLATILSTVTLLRGQNLILNGGFESPGLPQYVDKKFLTNGSTFLPGWTIIDDGVGEPPFYGNRNLNDAVLVGRYGLVLNQESGVRTTFRARVGVFYELSLWLHPDDCKSCTYPSPLRVTISGASYELPLVSGWSRQTVQFFTTNSVNTLELFNPSSTSDFKRFTLDEVSIYEVPGNVLTARLAPVVTVEGVIGAKYQIQAANNLNAPVWETLTNLVLTNSPQFFLDTNSVSGSSTGPMRIYRSIRLP